MNIQVRDFNTPPGGGVINFPQSQHLSTKNEFCLAKWLSKDISNLFTCGAVLYINTSFLYLLSDKMIVYFNMLGAGMKYRIAGEFYG